MVSIRKSQEGEMGIRKNPRNKAGYCPVATANNPVNL
jgi:hypothetical protein